MSEISEDKDQHTIINGLYSPLIPKQEFALGSLSPTSNNNTKAGAAGHMMMDPNERQSHEKVNNIFHRQTSQTSQEASNERNSVGG